VIKLGIDVHASTYVVVMKVDSSAPQRAKKMPPVKFLRWVHKLRSECEELHSCYEAGSFGYSLHRKLLAMGVNNYVIRPINWNTHRQKVKTDARDAYQMSLALDGYLRGNDRSFTVINAPTEAEERKRSLTRLRQTFVKELGQTRSEYGHLLRLPHAFRVVEAAENRGPRLADVQTTLRLRKTN
jgi:transposase